MIGSSICHLCSTAISGRKRATLDCYTPPRLFRGLRLLLLDWKLQSGPKRLIGPGRVKSWRTDFTRLKLKLREESCWTFQLRCSWTCSLVLLALLIVAILTVSWVCIRSCIPQANVVADNDGSQKRGAAPAVRGGGMVRRVGFHWCRSGS